MSFAGKVVCRLAIAGPTSVAAFLAADHAWLRYRGAFEVKAVPSSQPEGKSCLVIGGGVVAVFSAYFLNRKGFKVTLLEASHDVGLGTSNVNAGTIRPSRSKTLVTFANVKKCINTVFMPGEYGSAYQFGLGGIIADLYYWRWGFRFVLNSLNSKLQERTNSFLLESSPHALATVQSVAATAGALGKGWELSPISLNIQCAEHTRVAAETYKQFLVDAGIKVESLTKAETLEREPSLKLAEDLVHGGYLTPGDFSGDCGIFTRYLGKFCISQGVEIISGARVHSLETLSEGPTISAVVTENGRRFEGFDHIVMAAGCGSAKLLDRLGVYLPIYCAKGYALDIKAAEVGLHMNTPALYFEPLEMFVTSYRGTTGEERVRVTSIAEFSGWDETEVRMPSLNALKARAYAVFPGVAAETWDRAEVRVGGRPWSVDDLPAVGGTRFTNLWINAGHGHFGWRFASISGEMLAAAMTGSAYPDMIDPKSLSLSRFQDLWRA